MMRPHQWIKNFFVLAGVTFSFQIASTNDWLNAFYSFVAFCLASSAVYISNDIYDIESDKIHETKKFRPIASGAVSIKIGLILASLLSIICIALCIMVSYELLLIVLFYFSINIFYTLYFKSVVVLDVFLISLGFMLRILAGTLGIEIDPSSWIIITGMMITLLLGFGKRRAEIACTNPGKKRKSLDSYSIPLLDSYISVCAAGTIICYALYTVSPDTVEIHQTSNLIFTTPIVTFGIFRYLYLIHKHGKGQDTSKDILNDISLISISLIWLISIFLIIKY